eukprot:Lankesteria_metandrocarpae@DN903_c0_g1_i1.p1
MRAGWWWWWLLLLCRLVVYVCFKGTSVHSEYCFMTRFHKGSKEKGWTPFKMMQNVFNQWVYKHKHDEMLSLRVANEKKKFCDVGDDADRNKIFETDGFRELIEHLQRSKKSANIFLRNEGIAVAAKLKTKKAKKNGAVPQLCVKLTPHAQALVIPQGGAVVDKIGLTDLTQTEEIASVLKNNFTTSGTATTDALIQKYVLDGAPATQSWLLLDKHKMEQSFVAPGVETRFVIFKKLKKRKIIR